MILKVSYRYQFKGDSTWHQMSAENLWVPDGKTPTSDVVTAAVVAEHPTYEAVRDATVVVAG